MHLKEKLETSQPKKILSLDGGGIRLMFLIKGLFFMVQSDLQF